MASTIQAHLLYAGHAAQFGDILSLTEQWISHNLRPDLPSTEYLPDIGDNPLSGNIINAQSIVNANLQFLVVKTITEQEYLEGDVRGTIYTVQYDDALEDAVTEEPTQDEDTVIVNISSGAQVDTYTIDPNDPSAQKIYVKNPLGEYEEGKNLTINKIVCLTNVSTTKRYRDKTLVEILAIGDLAGNVNNAGMWGQDVGNILYNGISTSPIQEIVNDTVEINWNVTNNYTIKHIPGIDLYNWQHTFYKGDYTLLYSDKAGTTIDLYPSETLPNDIP